MSRKNQQLHCKVPAQTLTKSLIAGEALALIDAEGLDAFSTRKLGTRLGVEAMALYHHFPSKHLLTAEIAATLRAQIPLPPADLGWRSWLGQAARSWRAMVLAHPNAVPLLIAHPADEGDALSAAQRHVLETAGLTPHDATRAARLLAAFVTGAVQSEIAQPEDAPAIFERGLVMLLDGIAKQIQRAREIAL
jgi:AcrR family transcriptional regulator